MMDKNKALNMAINALTRARYLLNSEEFDGDAVINEAFVACFEALSYNKDDGEDYLARFFGIRETFSQFTKPLAWAVYAEIDGKLHLQQPVYESREDAKKSLADWSESEKVQIVPLGLGLDPAD